MWAALLKADGSVEEDSSCWRLRIKKELEQRISQVSDGADLCSVLVTNKFKCQQMLSLSFLFLFAVK